MIYLAIALSALAIISVQFFLFSLLAKETVNNVRSTLIRLDSLEVKVLDFIAVKRGDPKPSGGYEPAEVIAPSEDNLAKMKGEMDDWS